MSYVYLNGKRLVPGCLMVVEDSSLPDGWTPEDEDAYSNPLNHLPSDGLTV